MTVGAIEPQFYAQLLRGLDFSAEDIVALPYQMDNTQWESLKTVFASKFKQKTQAEWTEIFQYTDACVQPALERDDIRANEHVQARGMFAQQEDGMIVPVPAPRLSDSPALSPEGSRMPDVGEHTYEVLREFQFSENEIQGLIAQNIVKQQPRSRL